MNWFQNHLNWTLLIALVAINAFTFLVVFLAYYYMAAEDADGVAVLTGLSNVVLTAIVGGWVMNQKGRSLLWLLLTPFWIGWVVWLALDNRKQSMPSRRNVTQGIPPPPITKAFTRERVATGPEVEQGKHCPTCGVRLPWDAKFCLECGANMPDYTPK